MSTREHFKNVYFCILECQLNFTPGTMEYYYIPRPSK